MSNWFFKVLICPSVWAFWASPSFRVTWDPWYFTTADCWASFIELRRSSQRPCSFSNSCCKDSFWSLIWPTIVPMASTNAGQLAFLERAQRAFPTSRSSSPGVKPVELAIRAWNLECRSTVLNRGACLRSRRWSRASAFLLGFSARAARPRLAKVCFRILCDFLWRITTCLELTCCRSCTKAKVAGPKHCKNMLFPAAAVAHLLMPTIF
mmetsp:Transcript_52282/g.114764  ORF Transcript_52282/g.114764 Transcript_52282/m.114764 type:complete len:209 (-) Transcript_52282:659-1285(-)